MSEREQPKRLILKYPLAHLAAVWFMALVSAMMCYMAPGEREGSAIEVFWFINMLGWLLATVVMAVVYVVADDQGTDGPGGQGLL